MGFTFPLFLLAALSVVVPIIIHLVNMRKYKQEFFPNIRFLRHLKVSSKRTAELSRFWLLLSRVLFLLSLVLAFTQPFLKKNGGGNHHLADYTVVYIDNSYSMSVKKEEGTLLAIAKNSAIKLIESSSPGMRYVILSNNHFYYKTPTEKEEALKEVDRITFSHKMITVEDLKNTLDNTFSKQSGNAVPIYIFSDFQKSTFVSKTVAAKKEKQSSFAYYLYPIKNNDAENVFIDSVAIEQSTLENNSSAYSLRLRLNRQNASTAIEGNLKFLFDGQLRNVKPFVFDKDELSYELDLPIILDESGKIKAELIVDALGPDFDDTFRIAAHIPNRFSVALITSSGQVNPYLQTAFNNMPGIKFKVLQPNSVSEDELLQNSLVIVQDGNSLNNTLATQLNKALAAGVNVLLFPPDNRQRSSFNTALATLSDIRLGDLDTTTQQAVSLQKDHPLLKGVFESVPENVQLPVAHNSFPVIAGLMANQQDIISFQNGNSLVSSFSFQPGNLYLVSTGLKEKNSNFPLSYFFAPMLYKMAVPSGAVQEYFTSIGSNEPLNITNTTSVAAKDVWHISGRGEDMVPPQRVTAKGLSVFVGKNLDKTGFYQMFNESGGDTLTFALNSNPNESFLKTATEDEVTAALGSKDIFWLDENQVNRKGWRVSGNSFDLWRIALVLALISLFIETVLLLRPKVKSFTKESKS